MVLIRTLWAYLFNIAVAVSLFANSVFGGKRYETVCARAWRWRDHKCPGARLWSWVVVSVTEVFEKDHCLRAFREAQVVRKGLRSHA